MTTLTLSLSDEDSFFINSEVAKGHHGDAGEYILTLIENERKRIENEAVLPLILEAFESGPATPFTDEDWEAIRREVRERLAEPSR